MRILHQSLLRRGNADRAKQLHAAPFRGDAIKFEMLLKRFDQLGADGQDGIERGHRVLEYDRERPAAKFAQPFGIKPHQILSVEPHAAGKFCLFRQQLQDGARKHGLAAAGFADNTERPAGADVQIDLIHRAKIAAWGRQVDRHILDGKQCRLGHSAP